MDPLLQHCVSLSMALLFASAAAHKVLDHHGFRIIVREYRLVPQWAVPPLALSLATLEAALVAGWLLLPGAALIPVASIALLAIYMAAIGINLARGRRDIDCGCGFGTVARAQTLTPWLVLRNALLMLVAASALLPIRDRELGTTDYLALAAAVTTAVMLFAAAGQLARNAAVIRGWRSSR